MAKGGCAKQELTLSYYPLLKVSGTQGWVTLCNFSPNNWETRAHYDQLVNVTWCSGNAWLTTCLGVLEAGKTRTVTGQELHGIVPDNALPLLSLTQTPLPAQSPRLPKLDDIKTTTPAWRASLGLSTSQAQTSYQGEMDPFPAPASLLTFGPFLQYGAEISNYLILMNLENSPIHRTESLMIYDTNSLALKGQFDVHNNQANIIPLDGLGIHSTDLPMFVCRTMAAIPLYFSRTANGAFLSLEHTHPPASLVIHGKRWETQKMLKNRWFEKVTS